MTARQRFLKEFPEAIADEAAALFIGAGVSVGAGYPSWKELLKEIGEELGVSSSDVGDLAALAQWSIRKHAGRNRVLKTIREQVGTIRPVPEALEIVARLPIRNLWTTNYDRLIERAFEAVGRPIDPVSVQSDLAIRARPGAAHLFKMHGSVERLEDIVIATDDYELFRSKRGAFLPLLQAHLTSHSVLFIGLSFADPNVRHVLSLIRESFTEAPPEHFAIVRTPQRKESANKKEYEARLNQHRLWSEDLLRYGLNVVEIEHYDEIPELLIEVERAAAGGRVWVSGSWPLNQEHRSLEAFARELGDHLGHAGLALVSGSGLTVGSEVVSGFIEALRRSGSWDLDRRLIVRPFSQPARGADPDLEAWARLRDDMAHIAGVVVFVGGAKLESGQLSIADGVLAEFDAALRAGAFLLPVPFFGGAAEQIAEKLFQSDLPSNGTGARRPTDQELVTMRISPETAMNVVQAVIGRVSRKR